MAGLLLGKLSKSGKQPQYLNHMLQEYKNFVIGQTRSVKCYFMACFRKELMSARLLGKSGKQSQNFSGSFNWAKKSDLVKSGTECL
jgi:hypothetical protein